MSAAMRPMKLTSARLADVETYISDPSWVMEQKMDGARGLVKITPDGVEWFAGNGGPVKFAASLKRLPLINAQLARALSSLEAAEDGYEIWLDGEVMIDGGDYRVFDLPFARIPHRSVSPLSPYEERRAVLALLLGGYANRPGYERFSIVQVAASPEGKASLFEKVHEAGGEGVVVKHVTSRYEPGIRSRNQRKIKFTRTADVVVTAVNRPDRSHGNFTLAVYGDDGALVPVGRCSAIGKPDVAVGDVIEVAFQNWSGTRLVQPRMKRTRPDREPASCGLEQMREYSRERV